MGSNYMFRSPGFDEQAYRVVVALKNSTRYIGYTLDSRWWKIRLNEHDKAFWSGDNRWAAKVRWVDLPPAPIGIGQGSDQWRDGYILPNGHIKVYDTWCLSVDSVKRIAIEKCSLFPVGI